MFALRRTLADKNVRAPLARFGSHHAGPEAQAPHVAAFARRSQNNVIKIGNSVFTPPPRTRHYSYSVPGNTDGIINATNVPSAGNALRWNGTNYYWGN